jgi:hypothetical protein
MTKSGTTFLSALLFVAAAMIGLGSSLRAFDYLADAGASKTVQAAVQLLQNPLAAAVILLFGIALAVKAFRMPPDASDSRAAQRTAPPNMVVLSTHILPIDRNFQPSGPQTGAHGAFVRFRNEVHPRRGAGPMIGTRATISIKSGTAAAHATGLWVDSRSSMVDFLAGDMHELLVAVRVGNETNLPDVLSDDVRTWNISGPDSVTVLVQLVGGIEKPITRDFEFTLQLAPTFEISKR